MKPHHLLLTALLSLTTYSINTSSIKQNYKITNKTLPRISQVKEKNHYEHVLQKEIFLFRKTKEEAFADNTLTIQEAHKIKEAYNTIEDVCTHADCKNPSLYNNFTQLDSIEKHILNLNPLFIHQALVERLRKHYKKNNTQIKIENSYETEKNLGILGSLFILTSALYYEIKKKK